MAPPTKTWLLKPIIPSPPALPRLNRELRTPAHAVEARPPHELTALYPSGTWRVGTRIEDEREHDERLATSDSEAPTVRPGALQRLKRR